MVSAHCPGNTEGSCDGGATCPSKPYHDVDTGRWYHEGIDYAIAHGLMNGVGNGMFEPESGMTRAHARHGALALRRKPGRMGESF